MLHELGVELERVAAAGIPVAAAYLRGQIRARARHRTLEYRLRRLELRDDELERRTYRCVQRRPW